jgi:hypothetical protein
LANAYTITGDELDPGAATDPLLCRVSGTVKDVFGNPVVGIAFTIRHFCDPISVSTDILVIRERYDMQTDSTGFISFDAIRNSVVRVEIRNVPNLFFQVEIPDAASIDLIDLILPYIVSVSFVDADPLTVSLGDRFQTKTDGLLSNTQTIDASAGCTFVSSNEAIVRPNGAGWFTAAAIGSVTITVTAVSEEPLGLNEDPSGNPIARLDVPATTLPAPLTVNVV